MFNYAVPTPQAPLANSGCHHTLPRRSSPGIAVTNHVALTAISQCLLSAGSPQSPKPLYPTLNVEFTRGNLYALPTGGGESSVGMCPHMFEQPGQEREPGELKTGGGMCGAGWGPCLCSSVMVPCGTVSLIPSYFLLQKIMGRERRRRSSACHQQRKWTETSFYG